MVQYNKKRREPTTDVSSGYKYWFRCTDHSHGCTAGATVAPNGSVTLVATHTPTCRFRGNVKGLQPSEKALLAKSDSTSNPSTAKAAQDALVRHRAEMDRVKREGGEDIPYAIPVPSVRSCRYHNNTMYERPVCNPDDIESIEHLLDRYHADLHRGNQNPPPREVVVIKIEQWQSAAKRQKKSAATPAGPKEEPKTETNSLIILSTPALMDLCKAHKGASMR